MSARVQQTVTDRRFAHITVTGEGFVRRTPSGSRKRVVPVRCDCGFEFETQLNNLVSNNTSQCWKCGVKVRAQKARKRRRPDGEVNRDQAMQAYRRAAKKRGLLFELSLDDFLGLTQQRCHYCGLPPSNRYHLKDKNGGSRNGSAFIYSGIDRVDPSIGYNTSNCVSCCRTCNVAKSDMTQSEFFAWIQRVQTHRKE